MRLKKKGRRAQMKNKIYYLLFVCYVAVVGVILYINRGFTGDINSIINVAINLGILLIIGILFLISAVSFGRLNRSTKELVEWTEKMQQQYAEEGKNIWRMFLHEDEVFVNKELNQAFDKYRDRINGYRTKNGYNNTCELEEYINEDVLDKISKNYFNSGISGTLTGLGILGTFIGLSLGLGSFHGEDIYTISDNVGPLLSGMKVAFHTSVYGIFFSLVFNVAYRSIMADAYEKLEVFLKVFKQCAQPVANAEDDHLSVMLMYQANMSSSLKQMLELMKGTAKEQTEGVERIVNQFIEQMGEELGIQTKKLGSQLKGVTEMQNVSMGHVKDLVLENATLIETNRKLMEELKQVMQRQDHFARELALQKEQLNATCDEISNQLYTYEQMRNIYEK